MTVMTMQIPDGKFIALMGMEHGKVDKVIIADTYQEMFEHTAQKDMISMIHYRDDNR